MKYLKSAFFAKADIKGLGKMPLNILGLISFAILGFAEPGFWLLGIGLEVAYLSILSTNKRFQKVVDAENISTLQENAEYKRKMLISKLPPESKHSLNKLEQKAEKILNVYKDSGSEDFIIESSKQALNKLIWVYLKLLISKQNLLSANESTSNDSLRKEIINIEEELKSTNLSDSLRESKTATLGILKKRYENIKRRQELLKEIDADLIRIENQADLALENAYMQDRPDAVSANIELASHLLDEGFYGESESVVLDIDNELESMEYPQTKLEDNN